MLQKCEINIAMIIQPFYTLPIDSYELLSVESPNSFIKYKNLL